ncbi:isochorismatase [Siphonobacter sp. BAB-5385]|uniref:cysteine hydrolase family protein n=1 Tax=unclassified Siphonobacter TaxID=2635712 RepID=UPI000B9EAE8B|nr:MULTISPECIES: isochorismatase family cysteine hydrolase [unclassified Siphonobacter]OZI07624.1 isochorismatase [Siphonobacter sp. BAB-5385]PMD90398.1 isochorismatase [Siphonobacter sp. BAB-5405]
MSEKNADLHGNVLEQSPVALLVIDMINDLEFPEGEEFVQSSEQAARNIVRLKEQARQHRIPVIYANDNFGRWRSDFNEVIEHVLHDQVRGQRLAELLRPDQDDYFVLKPKHSAFYATTLSTLLQYFQVKRLILTGISTDSCIAFTASDAYMRDYEVYVPSDCTTARNEEFTKTTLDFLERSVRADTTPSTELDLGKLRQ